MLLHKLTLVSIAIQHLYLSNTDATPTLKMLTLMKTPKGNKIRVIQTVAPRWQRLGVLLDFDESGKKLEFIETKNHCIPEECCREMFQHWLKGNGVRPCSWRTLIELLEDCDFEMLAEELYMHLGF